MKLKAMISEAYQNIHKKTFLVACNLSSTFVRLKFMSFQANLADFGILVTFYNIQ